MTDGDSDHQSAICVLMTLEGKCTDIHGHRHQNMEEHLHVLAGGCILILHVRCKNYN